MKLEIGGGNKKREGWHNLDYYAKNPDFKIDLRKCEQLPINDNIVSKVFTSHCIEHLSDESVHCLFNNLNKVMKKDSVLRVVCPDADLLFDAYTRKDEDMFNWIFGSSLEERFVNCFVSYKRGMGVPNLDIEEVKRNYKALSKEYFLNWIKTLVDLNQPYIAHCNWWNERKLITYLLMAGFNDIKVSRPYQSRDIELRKNDFDGHLKISLFVEAIK